MASLHLVDECKTGCSFWPPAYWRSTSKREKELRERENHWIYKLATLAPHGLNDDDGFYAQNKKSRAGVRAR